MKSGGSQFSGSPERAGRMSPGARVWVTLMILGPALAAEAQTGEAPAGPTAFLRQLAGEWSVVSEARLGPGQEPIVTESREVARFLGEKWLVAEGHGPAPGGQPTTSILTLGYIPSGSRFVGTYISSMQSHLWSYTGTLDDTGTVLILETEGPVLGDPDRTARYRETIEVRGPDHRVMTSMILGPDGEWFEFARSEYRRQERPDGHPPR